MFISYFELSKASLTSRCRFENKNMVLGVGLRLELQSMIPAVVERRLFVKNAVFAVKVVLLIFFMGAIFDAPKD